MACTIMSESREWLLSTMQIAFFYIPEITVPTIFYKYTYGNKIKYIFIFIVNIVFHWILTFKMLMVKFFFILSLFIYTYQSHFPFLPLLLLTPTCSIPPTIIKFSKGKVSPGKSTESLPSSLRDRTKPTLTPCLGLSRYLSTENGHQNLSSCVRVRA